MDWTLERVNDPRNFIILEKHQRSYSCGRKPDNDIICPSIVVSRQHCLFVRTGDGFAVIDLGSSNGIYVNGLLQEPKAMIELHDNDIIGIGSVETYRDNEPMYVYKLRKGNRNLNNLEEFDDLLTQRSESAKEILESAIQVVPQSEPTNLVSSVAENARCTRKRNLPIANTIELDSGYGDPKIPKCNNEHRIIQDNNANVSQVKATVVLADVSAKQEDMSPEVEEIQEIWSTIKKVDVPNPKTDLPKPKPRIDPPKPKINNTDRPVTPVVRTNGADMDKFNRSTMNLESNEDQMSSRVVEVSIDCEEKLIKPITTEATPETIRKSVSLKQSEINDCHVSVPSYCKETIANVSKPKSTKLHSKPSCSAWLTSDVREPDKNHTVPSKSSRKNRSKKKNEDRSKEKKSTNKSAQKVTTDVSNATKTRSLKSPPKSMQTAEKEIKPEHQSFHDQNPSATSSPFKLRTVKEEPKTSFSIIDIVDLSDDDEDIFPSSQLFDTTKNEDVIDIEDGPPEIKSEHILDAYDIKEEIIDPEYEEIIVPSDSDDEDNPWLQRLSESQRIKEEEPESPLMDFYDEMKNLNLDLLNAAVLADAKVPESDEPEGKKEGNHFERSIKPSQLMSVNDIEKELNKENEDDLDCGIFHVSDPLPTLTEEKRTPEKELDKSLPITQATPKGPKIIEPLHLPQRRRSSVKDSFTASSKRDDTSSLASTSTGRAELNDYSIEVSKLPSNLTSKQKRLLQIDSKIKQKQYEDEQRQRRVKNKWAQNVPLPLGKRKSLPISKNEKLEIVNQRKEKLKALANKGKMNSAKPSVERVAPQGKAKISAKNRGDFLISEQQQQAASTSKASSQPGKPLKNKKESKKSTKVAETPSTSITAQSQPSKLASSQKISSQTVPLKSSKNKKASVNKVSAQLHEERLEDKSKGVDEVTNSIATVKIDETIGLVKEVSLNQKENRVPNSLDKKRQGKIKKKVRFDMAATKVKEYQIDPNNKLKTCPGKDALIPKDKLLVPPQQVVNTEQYPRLEEFLFHILTWNPSWLEEQKHLKSEPPIVVVDSWLKEQKLIKSEPPIVDDNGLIPLLTNYKNYKEYYHIMVPLLLLELWHGITKEFESIDQNKRRQTLFCSIVNNSITSEKLPSVNATLTTMMLEMLANEDEIKRQIHPVYGDLVFLELCYRNDDGKLHFSKVFAYITHLHKSKITPHTFFNRDLGNYVRRPTHVLTYTVLTRPLIKNLCNRPLRLRCVTYLRSKMRMVQALQLLPRSPLLLSILNPKFQSRKDLAQPQKPLQNSLITKDKLNSKQAEAVFKTTESIARKEPKICLIQGPPGTGKSHVIVNMVMQVLYGDNRYRRKDASLRILLCAPSNAAVDEIVLRLLQRRAKLSKDDRFKMVRVGMVNTMHPKVKEISVEELAKRDLKRTHDSYRFWGQSMDSVEEEKRFLEAKINALQSKLTSTHKVNEDQAHCNRLKLADLKTRYDVIKKCGQNESNTDPQYALKQERDTQNNILLRANIIACTLSSCYTNIMESAFGDKQLNTSKFAPSGKKNNISVCIVDEATQSCEAETLIPLMLGVNTLVLVGDPAQLPATIISQRAKRLGLDQSLFSRIQRAQENLKNNSIIMLDTQYRMDSHISHWPNQFFYGGKLKNAEVNDGRTVLPFYPYRILNMATTQSHDKFSNTEEAEFVANLIHSMIDHIDQIKLSNHISIGVITPYKNQQYLVEAKINQRITTTMENLRSRISIEINTVDSFQGHERDIIVMSCVRTNGIGFLSDPQRLCVALTRAKHCLVLCGNFAAFKRDGMWNALLEDAQSRRNYIRIQATARPNEILSHLVR
ncbi:uncharacterized protein LOC124410993 [Diprion similis]|uniref:uncharacterized protein LOC124410993 n=1 Tax=Diprion similis TaxID=362088 RepID=UPI001EF7F45A|nr:uncharacterized protein LOC124410993 [Diprion similis]